MKLLQILKRMLSCGATEASESTEVLESAGSFVEGDERLKDYIGLDDLRLVAGDSTLILVCNVLIGGLHNVLSYDSCHDTQGFCSEINAIIGKNLEETYESIVVKIGENQYLLNIGVNLLLGNSPSLPQKRCEALIDAFYPIIKRFVDEHIVDNKVGIYSDFIDGEGTSVGLLGLVNHLEKDGYMCCGVGTSDQTTSDSLKRAKGWQGFKYIDLAERIGGIDILPPEIDILSLLHNELVAKMGTGTVRSKNVEPEPF